MPALSITPALTLITALRSSPASPLRVLLRTTSHRLRPPRPLPHIPNLRRSAAARMVAAGQADHTRMSDILCEHRNGGTPTIVLGGFVPDATEQVYLLRGRLLKQGSVYYFRYPRKAFCLDLFCAQLDDLVQELSEQNDTPPVIFSVSFGCGLAMEWLRRRRESGRPVAIAGLIMVSPVTCAEDLIAPNETKASTLLGRAIQPYMSDGPVSDSSVEKSRTIFARMFEAGAQNQQALGALLSRDEARRLKDAVISNIQSINTKGACERVGALRRLMSPLVDLATGRPALTEAPVLVLYAEKEGTVLTATAPGVMACQNGLQSLFPNGECHTISNPKGSPVQHASLIFHCNCFLPKIQSFYRRIKARRNLRTAA